MRCCRCRATNFAVAVAQRTLLSLSRNELCCRCRTTYISPHNNQKSPRNTLQKGVNYSYSRLSEKPRLRRKRRPISDPRESHDSRRVMGLRALPTWNRLHRCRSEAEILFFTAQQQPKAATKLRGGKCLPYIDKPHMRRVRRPTSEPREPHDNPPGSSSSLFLWNRRREYCTGADESSTPSK